MTSRGLVLITVAGVLLVFLIEFDIRRPDQSTALAKEGYSVDLTELKRRFNADKKKLRLLMLLSPT